MPDDAPVPTRSVWPLIACIAVIVALALVMLLQNDADEDDIAIAGAFIFLSGVLLLQLFIPMRKPFAIRIGRLPEIRFHWVAIVVLILAGGTALFAGFRMHEGFGSRLTIGFGYVPLSAGILAIIFILIRQMKS